MSQNAATYNLIRNSTSDPGDDRILFNTSIRKKATLIDGSAPISLNEVEIGSNRESAESRILNKATWASAYINLTSTVIGAGILGLPHAFSRTGLLGGSAILLLCACSSAFALHFLTKCAKRIPAPVSFYSVAEEALPGYSSWIDFAVAIKCYGVATSYLVVIGDLMPAAMHQLNAEGIYKQRSFWVVMGFVVVAPLSCFQSLDALKYTSSLSITFILFLTVIIVMFVFPTVTGLDPCKDHSVDQNCRGQEDYYLLNTGSLRALSVFVFGYTCQQNIFSIINELQEPTQARIDSIIMCSISTAFTVFLIVGLSGYVTYGSNVASDLLKSYPEMPVTTAARICVSMIVSFSYPLQCNPARRSVLTLLRSVFGGGQEPSLSVHRVRYTLITGFFLVTSLLIALTVKDLSLVLSFVGATGSTTVSYILPGIFYYNMFKDEGPKWKRDLSLIQFLTGLIVVPVCLSFLFF